MRTRRQPQASRSNTKGVIKTTAIATITVLVVLILVNICVFIAWRLLHITSETSEPNPIYDAGERRSYYSSPTGIETQDYDHQLYRLKIKVAQYQSDHGELNDGIIKTNAEYHAILATLTDESDKKLILELVDSQALRKEAFDATSQNPASTTSANTTKP